MVDRQVVGPVTDLSTLLAAGFLVLFTVALVLSMSSYPVYALAVWGVVAVFEGLAFYPSVSIGAWRVLVSDTLAVATLIAVLFRTRRSRVLRPSLGYLLVLVLLVLNLTRGSFDFGLAAAANEIRTSLLFTSALVYFSSIVVDDSTLAFFYRAWPAASILFVPSALVFIAAHGIDSYESDLMRGLIDNRPLGTTAAFMVAQGSVILLLTRRAKGALLWLPLGASFALLLVSTQRSVWVATAIGLASSVLLSRTLADRVIRERIVRMSVLSMAALAAMLVGGFRSVWFALDSAFASNSSLFWRIDGWRLLINARLDGDRTDLLFGQPAGYGFDRYMREVLVQFSPHSGYVTPLLVVGLVGAVALVLTYLGALRRLIAMTRRRDGTQSGALVFAVLTVMNLVYFISYAGTIAAGVVMGLATAYANHTSPRRAAAKAPPTFQPV